MHAVIRFTFSRRLLGAVTALRRWARKAGDFGYDQFEKAELKDVMKCRHEKDLYLVLVDDKMVNPCWDLPKVVVVGAGLAGLSAAQALVSSGFTDVTVLEASDGPGGRILSYEMRSIPIDLGATHIEGTSPSNPVLNLASREGLLSSMTVSNPYMGTFMTSSGCVLPPSVESAVYHAFENIEKEAKSYFINGVKCNETVWDFFCRKIGEECGAFPETSRRIARRALFGRLNELKSYWGADLNNMSVDQYGAFVKIPGCDARVPTGMIGIIGQLIRDLPDHSVKYCKEVKVIEWGEGRVECPKSGPEKKKKKKSEKTEDQKKDDCRRVSVICSDGSVFLADYVIVTCSLGYLKQNYAKLFVPTLPTTKIDSIQALGWGHLCNIYLLYNEPFWVWKEGLIRLAWSEEELVNKGSWLTGVGTIRQVLASSQMLMVKVGGDEALQAEKLSVERLGDDLTKLMRCFSGDSTLPYPFLIIPSKWASNKWVLGGKSYISAGSKHSDICALAEPLPAAPAETPMVLFAGEATSASYFGTTHGARLSGLREAERIIKLTHKFQGRPRDTFHPICDTEPNPECFPDARKVIPDCGDKKKAVSC